MITAGIVLVVGISAVEQRFNLSSLPKPGEEIDAFSAQTGFGGAAANVAHTLAILGSPVKYVGAFPDSPEGHSAKCALEEVGVDLSGSVLLPATDAPRTVHLVSSSGEFVTVTHKPVAFGIKARVLEDAWSDDVNIVYSDGLEFDASLTATGLAESSNKEFAIGVEDGDERYLRLIERSQHVIGPARPILNLTNESLMRAALDNLWVDQQHVMICAIDAEIRAEFRDRTGYGMVSAKPSAWVDKSGAIDVFRGAYIAGHLAGKTTRWSLEFAAEVAGIKCGQLGARIVPSSIGAHTKSLRK